MKLHTDQKRPINVGRFLLLIKIFWGDIFFGKRSERHENFCLDNFIVECPVDLLGTFGGVAGHVCKLSAADCAVRNGWYRGRREIYSQSFQEKIPTVKNNREILFLCVYNQS